MQNDIIAKMTNIGESGQDEFVKNWAEYARLTLYEMGVSNKFINSAAAAYVLAKIVTDTVDNGELSKSTEALIATLRVNHPHSEDI
jgi:hypothetical protein